MRKYVQKQLFEALRQLGRERDELQTRLAARPNTGRWLAVTGSIAAASGIVWYWWHEELSFVGQAVGRSARTTFTVLRVTDDYKRSLNPWWSPSASNAQPYYNDPLYLEAKRACNIRAAQRLLRLFQQNGGIYIKLGQHLSALEYILPAEFCEVMAVLQDAAPKSPLQDVEQVIKEELGIKALDDLFEEFEAEPIGAASLAQVHRARLKEGNVPVAVKVQHRSIRSYAEVDMFVVSLAVALVKRVFPEFAFDWLAEEMRINLPRELDFVSEAHNAERVRRNFDQDSSSPVRSWLRVPNVYWKWTTPRVLTMEFCRGARVTDLEYLRTHKIDPYIVSNRLTLLFSEMIFLHGFVHCDPHPGNVLVCASHSAQQRPFLSWQQRTPEFQLVLLDHGLYREISNEYRLAYAGMWQALVNGDVHGIRKFCQQLGAGDAYRLFSSILTHRTWNSVSVRSISSQTSLKETELLKERAPGYLAQVADLLAKLPRPLLLLLKTNDLLRAIERSLQEPGDTRPVQSFFITAHYCAKAILRAELGSSQPALPIFSRVRVYWMYWRTVFKICSFEALVRLKLFIFGKGAILI
jgi:aarF domain-containing kinase